MKFSPEVEKYRVCIGQYISSTGDDFGMFFIPSPTGRDLRIIASSGDSSAGVNWEHVSVSLPSRCPTWAEMDFIKRLFWDDEECVMQLHPPRSTWVNNHSFCLHLWKPIGQEIPLPPQVAV